LYEEACNLLRWDSNRNALWELNERLKAPHGMRHQTRSNLDVAAPRTRSADGPLPP
jgi:hypothetical protein